MKEKQSGLISYVSYVVDVFPSPKTYVDEYL